MIYISIYALLFYLFWILNGIFFHEFFRINTIFNIVWSINIIFCVINPYNWFLVSNQVHVMVVSSIIIVNVCYYFFSTKQMLPDVVDIFNMENECIFHTSTIWFYMLNIFVYIELLPIVKKSLVIIRNNGFARLRVYAYDSSMGLASTAKLTIIQSIVEPIILLSIIYATVLLCLGVRKIGTMIIAISEIVLYILAFGGRGIFFDFMAIVVLTAFVIYRKAVLEWIFSRKTVLLLIILGVCISIYIISLRMSATSTITKTILSYFAAPFVFLSESLKHGNIEFGYTKGTGIFSFIATPSILMMKAIGVNIDLPVAYVSQRFNGFIRISDMGDLYNSLATMLGMFLFDFGYWGIAIGSLLIGGICALFERIFIEKKNMTSFVLFLFIALNIIKTVRSYPFSSNAFFFCLFVLSLNFRFLHGIRIGFKIH